MHKIRLLQSAIHDLEPLDKPTAARIVQRIEWLAKKHRFHCPKAIDRPAGGTLQVARR